MRNTTHSTRRPLLLTSAALLVAAAAWIFGDVIQRHLTLWAALRTDAVEDELVATLADAVKDPLDVTQRFWSTGKIPHRQAAVRYLRQACANGRVRPDDARDLLIDAAKDCDLSVVELALGILGTVRDPGLKPAALCQLENRDPDVRRLALRALRSFQDPTLIPVLMRMLDDSSPTVVTATASVLRDWTGQDFGIRQWQATPEVGEGERADDGAGRLREGVNRWKSWWATRPPEERGVAPSPRAPVPPPIGGLVADFSLPSPDGRPLRLSELRGRVVVLHFWATWCTACLPEVSTLNQLQAESDSRVALLAVALDGATEPHEHEVGEAGANSVAAADASPRDHVEAFMMQRGVRYPVAIDPENRVGRRFNGGELPTTVLIDAEGRIRRRFIGSRPLGVWREFLRELAPQAPSH